MTPKKKAESLIGKLRDNSYVDSQGFNRKYTIENALICVDEILKNFEGLHKPEYTQFDIYPERKFTFDEGGKYEAEYDTYMTGYDMQDYWKAVKREIKKL